MRGEAGRLSSSSYFRQPGVGFFSRNGLSPRYRFRYLCEALAHALPEDSMADGVLVAPDPSGRPRFNLLQNSALATAPVVLFAFDLLRLDGQDLTQKSLRERRDLLTARIRDGAGLCIFRWLAGKLLRCIGGGARLLALHSIQASTLLVHNPKCRRSVRLKVARSPCALLRPLSGPQRSL